MKDRIRIKDIATKAGVSSGTVDRVLHKRGNVSEKSKAKVLQALESMDYSPNLLASALAYNKEWKIAALMPFESKDPFWRQPKDGILTALKAVKDYGIDVDFYHFEENDVSDFKINAGKILEHEYHSVIVAPLFTNQSIEFLNKLDERGVSYVLINTFLELTSANMLCYIGQDSYHSGTLGAKLLAFGLSAGEKAMICHLEEKVYDSQHLIDKERGFKDYFSNHSFQDIEVVTVHYAYPYDDIGLTKYFKDQLEKYPETKGIFITTSRAFRAVNALKSLDKPELKIVGFDLIDENLAYLDSENIDFLINQNPFKQGYLALINVFNFLIRKTKPPRLQHLSLDVAMKENVNYYTNSNVGEIPIVL